MDEITNILGWKCSFDELDVQATIISSGELSCVTHPSELDLMSVKLLLKDHDLEVDTGFTFQYHDKLEIRSIFPESALTIGDTMINISISGLRQVYRMSVYLEIIGSLLKLSTTPLLRVLAHRWTIHRI